MLVLRKVHYALQNAVYKSPTGRTKTVSIPLRQLLHVGNTTDPGTPAPVLPAEIWFLILEFLGYRGCLICKHKLLCTLALVSRVFNQFATKALYQTLDLRFSGECEVSHQCLGKFYWYPKPHIAVDLLRNKLDRLDRTLRLPQGPVLLIRHLKLPEVNITKHPTYVQNILKILPNWVNIFELCSGRLESVSGLGNLWSYLHHFNRSELRTRVCDAIENNPNWTEWDWLWDSWGYAWWSALVEEPRILEMYRSWKNLRHVSIDTAAWAVSVLGPLPELYSLSIECGDRMSDLGGIFQQVPLKGLKSLSVKAWVSPQEMPKEFDHTEPLNPLIDYLERCRLQPSPAQTPSLSVLTNLDISCRWSESHMFSPDCFYPKAVNLDEFLFSIFTLAPLLSTFKLDLRTPHEVEVKLPPAPGRVLGSMAHQCTSFTARNLRSMTISIPSRNSKAWLAAKIGSGAFPNLSCFIFRSAMTRRTLSCGTMFCDCTLDSSSEFLALNDFGREQDSVLIKACQEAGVREWEMQILHIDSVWGCHSRGGEEFLGRANCSFLGARKIEPVFLIHNRRYDGG